MGKGKSRIASAETKLLPHMTSPSMPSPTNGTFLSCIRVCTFHVATKAKHWPRADGRMRRRTGLAIFRSSRSEKGTAHTTIRERLPGRPGVSYCAAWSALLRLSGIWYRGPCRMRRAMCSLSRDITPWSSIYEMQLWPCTARVMARLGVEEGVAGSSQDQSLVPSEPIFTVQGIEHSWLFLLAVRLRPGLAWSFGSSPVGKDGVWVRCHFCLPLEGSSP